MIMNPATLLCVESISWEARGAFGLRIHKTRDACSKPTDDGTLFANQLPSLASDTPWHFCAKWGGFVGIPGSRSAASITFLRFP